MTPCEKNIPGKGPCGIDLDTHVCEECYRAGLHLLPAAEGAPLYMLPPSAAVEMHKREYTLAETFDVCGKVGG